MTKGFLFERMMEFDEKDLEKFFPHGARQEGKRWIAVEEGEEVDLSLKQLLKEKKKRIEKPRLLHKDSTRGYTHDPHMAIPREPEAVDKETQQEFSDEARERFRVVRGVELEEREMRSALNQLKQLCLERAKMGLPPTPVIRDAIAALKMDKAA